MQLAANVTATELLSHVEARLVATELTDADLPRVMSEAALIGKLKSLATVHGGLFNIPFTALPAAEWDRLETLNDLGLL